MADKLLDSFTLEKKLFAIIKTWQGKVKGEWKVYLQMFKAGVYHISEIC